MSWIIIYKYKTISLNFSHDIIKYTNYELNSFFIIIHFIQLILSF